MTDWSNTGGGVGQTLFLFGKFVAIVGRIGFPALCVAAFSACLAQPQVLLIIGYAAGPLLVAWLLLESLARVLMIAGNWLSQTRNRHV
ncbi:hypothetical protein ACG04Q_20090 [Roseateles sp. DXS20W]|uniref:Uncharacterized protein n=1 Tax=Pelomonas lactea TaxID=3299030 RepID=A0ABW7GPJ7_9BURK